MNGQYGGIEPGQGLDGLPDGVWDIVQLEVEKNLLVGRDQALGEGKPARIGELIADLIEAHHVPEPLDEPLRLFHGC